jgi:hypothetical protein
MRATAAPRTASRAEGINRAGAGFQVALMEFRGPDTVHAFMQEMGLVNDHVPKCVVADQVRQARAGFRLPVPKCFNSAFSYGSWRRRGLGFMRAYR